MPHYRGLEGKFTFCLTAEANKSSQETRDKKGMQETDKIMQIFRGSMLVHNGITTTFSCATGFKSLKVPEPPMAAVACSNGLGLGLEQFYIYI